jgi:hypothetical protein
VVSNPPADLAGIVNASGFMLQLALEDAVRASERRHRFEIEAREYPWRRGQDSGFIDLLLGRNSVRLTANASVRGTRTGFSRWALARTTNSAPDFFGPT